MPRNRSHVAPAVHTTANFDALADTKYVLLTTFKKDTTPVPTALWSVGRDGRVFMSTEARSGKVKRLRNNPRVTISACNMRGTPTGPTYAATAQVLTGDPGRQAHELIETTHRWAKPFYRLARLARPRGLDMVGIVAEPSTTPLPSD